MKGGRTEERLFFTQKYIQLTTTFMYTRTWCSVLRLQMVRKCFLLSLHPNTQKSPQETIKSWKRLFAPLFCKQFYIDYTPQISLLFDMLGDLSHFHTSSLYSRPRTHYPIFIHTKFYLSSFLPNYLNDLRPLWCPCAPFFLN